MTETLVVMMPALSATSVHYACFDAAGSLIQQQYHADAAMLASQALERRVVVVVPSLAVACLCVTLPKLSRRALATALPYALEDQLIADPDTLHYTLVQYKPNEVNEVLVVDKALVQSWLTVCRDFGLEPDALIPSALMLKHEPQVWTVAINEDVAIRINETLALACDLGNLNAVLTQAFDLYGQPKALHVYAKTKSTLSVSVPVFETMLSASGLIDLTLCYPGADLPINLLHGEFQPRKKQAVNRERLTQVQSLGVSVWLVLVLMFPMASWLMLTWQDAMLHRSIIAIATPYATDLSSVESARSQLQHKLMQAREGGGDGLLMHLLAEVGRGMKDVPGMQMERLEFHSPQLILSVSAQSPDVFSRWSQALSAYGLIVKENSAIITGGRVNASVTIRKA